MSHRPLRPRIFRQTFTGFIIGFIGFTLVGSALISCGPGSNLSPEKRGSSSSPDDLFTGASAVPTATYFE